MNFCAFCGKEMESDSKFCSICGKQNHQIEETAASAEINKQAYPSPTPKKKLSKKWWVIIGIVALLVVGGSSAFTMFLNKNPKELFLLSEVKAYNAMVEEFKNKYGEDIEFQKALLESPSSSEVKVSGNLEMETEGNYDLEMVQEILDQTTLIIQSSQDPKEQEGNHKLALEVDGTNLVDVEVVQTKTQAGLRVPFLYDQFFYLNFEEYGQFMRMIDPYYEGPETLEINNMNWEDLKFSEKELESLKDRYSKFLLSVLKDESFSLEKGVKLEHEGEQLTVREITFELSPNEVNDLLSKFFDQLIEDEELHSLIADRAIKIAEVASNGEELGIEIMDKDSLVEDMKSGLQEAKSDLNEVAFPKGFKSVIQIDKKEQIVSRQTEFAIGEHDVMNIKVVTKNIPFDKNKEFEEMNVELVPEDEEKGKMVLGYSNMITTESDKRTEDLKANFYFEEYGETQFDTKLVINSIFNGKNSGKQTIEREFDLSVVGDEFSEEQVIKGKIIEEKDISVKDKYANQKFNLETSIIEGEESGTIFVTVDSKTNLKNKVDLPKIDGDEGRNIAELTEYDMYEIMEEVQYRLYNLTDELGLNYY